VNAVELEEFFTYYYRSGSPERAVEALKYVLDNPNCLGPQPRLSSNHPSLYFFSRIVQVHPEVFRECVELLHGTSDDGREFVLALAELSGDDEVKELVASD